MTSDTRTSEDVADFAAALRSLRLEADSPTLTRLQSETGVSKSVLSSALRGQQLPSARTVDRLVRALGGDSAEWVARRDAVAAEAGASGGDARPEAAPDDRRRRVPLRWAAAAAAGAFVLGIAIAGTVGWAVGSSAVTQARAEASADAGAAAANSATDLDVADGVDPMRTSCRLDAKLAASDERGDGAFQVQMMYSDSCMAVWGRVTRYDGKANGESVSMLIYPQIDPHSDRNQSRSALDVSSVYTPLMIEPDVEARVCGIATVTVDDEPIELGPPLCI